MSSEGREVSREKWEITIDAMLIIGKYFEENEDYVNVMRVSKKYRDLVSMYHFNPIEDCSLFENMESQYFYSKPKDKSWLTTIMGYFGYGDKKSGMHQYVYLYPVDYEMFKSKKENEIFKIVELNRKETDYKKEYPLLIENGNCVVPEGVTSIGNCCFLWCTSLTSIQLPSSLIIIVDGAFRETNISTITIPDGVKKYECEVPLFIRNILKKKGIECSNYYLDAEDIRRKEIPIEEGKCIVPEGVTSIGNRCFNGCSSLTSIELPSSLISIGEYAFCHECVWESKVPLKQVVVPKNCKIGCYAFDDDCEVIRK